MTYGMRLLDRFTRGSRCGNSRGVRLSRLRCVSGARTSIEVPWVDARLHRGPHIVERAEDSVEFRLGQAQGRVQFAGGDVASSRRRVHRNRRVERESGVARGGRDWAALRLAS